MPRPGDRLGRYELQRRIGRGGMAEVWEALLRGPHGFERPVALKLLGPDQDDDQGRRWLLHEGRLGGLLSHPNLVQVHEVGVARGQVFVAMELVDGCSLRDLLRSGPLPAAALLSVGQQVAAGLAHCHEAGLVHRDVKPTNVLVERTGTVRLVDLGIARLLGATGEPAGTRGYMAPEQTRGDADPRADLFSLGVLLYSCAALRLPFGRGADAAQRAARADEHLAQPGFLAPVEDVVPGLGPVVASCLRARPEDRWASARDLADALALLDGEGPGLAAHVRARLTRLDTPPPPPRRTLPETHDGFFGRTSELAAIAQRLAADRWVTLLGPPGVGKSRLALEVAHRFDGPARYCDLSEARGPDDIAAMVARTLGVDADGEADVERTAHALRGRGPLLLVLDELDRCAPVAAQVLGRWLQHASDLRLLVTSRVALRAPAERVLVLGPLPEEAAVALFQERTRTSAEPQAPVRELVRRLDGLPLAVELAAAQARHRPVTSVLSQLRDGSELLATALEASRSLLAPWEEAALGQLAVFADGFELQAALAVLDLAPWPGAPGRLDVLTSLVDQSLVRLDPATGRFSMLLSVRQLADGLRSPADRAGDGVRHATWYAQLGTPDAVAALDRAGGEGRRRALARELGNLELAAKRAVALGEGALAAGAALAAWAVLEESGPARRGLELLEAVAALTPPARAAAVMAARGRAHLILQETEAARACLLPLEDHAEALILLADLDQVQGRSDDARRRLERARQLAAAQGDRAGEGHAARQLASVLQRRGRAEEALPLAHRALALHLEVGDRRSEARDRVLISALLRDGMDLDGARRELDAALAIARRLDASGLAGRTLSNLAVVHQLRGDLDAAAAAYEEALACLRQVGLRRSEAIVVGNLGTLHLMCGRHEEALRCHEQSIALHREGGDAVYAALARCNVGQARRSQGRPVEALACFEQAIEVFRAHGALSELARAQASASACERLLGRAEAELARLEQSLRAAEALGRAWNVAIARAELVHAWIRRGHVGAARDALVQLRADAEAADHGFPRGLALAASGLSRPPDDPAAVRELERALALLEAEPGAVTHVARVLLALAQRCPERAGELLERADRACAGPVRVPEAVDVLLARAARASDPAAADALRRAASERARALGCVLSR